MAKLGDLVAVIGADTSRFNKALAETNKKTRNFTKGIEKVGKTMTLAFSAPIALMTKSAIENFDKQAKAVAQVEQGLKTTGGAVGRTSAELQKMASDLQKTSLFGDEEILQGATAQLLTFTNISGQQFDRTQKAALDLATRLDGDLKGASIQLGKALNDPVANLSALSRSGIQFSKDQKAVIKSLTESGQLAEAQTIILDELEKQYGGSAEAAAAAGTGPLKQFQMAMGDLTEEFGAIIVEGITPFVKKLQGMVESFQGMSKGTKTVITVLAGLTAATGPALLAVSHLIKAFGTMKVAMLKGVIPAVQKMGAVLMANPYAVAAAALIGLGLAMKDYIHFSDSATMAQEGFQDALTQANVEAAKNGAQVDRLAAAVQDETASEEARLTALKKLQNISPKYFGGLDLEAVKMGELKTAVDAYKDSLLRAAKQRVLTAKLDELVARQEELKAEFAEGPSVLDQFLGAMSAFGNSSTFQMQRLGTEAGAVSEQIKLITDALAENESAMEANGEKTSSTATDYSYLAVEADKAASAISRAGESMAQMDSRSASEIDTGVGAPDQLAAYVPPQMSEDQQTVMDNFDAMSAKGAAFGETIGSAFKGLLDKTQQGADAMKNFAKSVVKSMLGAAKGAAVAAAAQSAAATGGAAVFVMPALVAGAMSLIEGAIGAIAFADGGIVSGPTMGLVGEYAGARNNPEVIAPLDKLQSMLGDTGGGGGTLQTKVSGTDLFIMLEKAGKNINRTR